MVSTYRQFLRGGVASPGLAAAKLSGKASALEDIGLAGFGGSVAVVRSAVLAASSNSFSTCTRISAPRLVSTRGGPGLISRTLGALAAAATGAGGPGPGREAHLPHPRNPLSLSA